MMTSTASPTTAPAVRCLELMGAGARSDFDDVLSLDAVNREDAAEPLACRTPGPDGFYATALWLRTAFADLTHRIDHVVADGDLVVIDATMSGRQVGNFVLYDPEGRPAQVWAPTGRCFAVRQSHWLRVADGRVAEHWATRDDMGMAEQCGWVPPSPAYLLRCRVAKRRLLRQG